MQKRSFVAKLCASLLLLCAFSTLHAAVYEQELDNGLRILVKPDHRAPVLVSQLWYRVGSADEPNGLTGISHVLEHMMFKGTKAYPQGQFSKIIAANGGRQNAMTSRDFTLYYQILASDRLAVSLKMEADRMRHLILKEKPFLKELAVVKEERHMRVDDNPQALSYERFSAQAHVSGPYHHPAIGWPSDLKQMKLADLSKWYKTWYAPNNATLVVVGDVQPKAVFALAKKYFANIPASTLPDQKAFTEQMDFGARRLDVKLPAKLPVLFMGYNVPSVRTSKDSKDAYALLIAGSILAGGDSARFQSQLLRQQHLVNSVGSDYDIYAKYNPLFILQAIPSPKHNLKEVEQALRQQIKTLQTTPVTPEELNRVKTQILADKIYSQDSLFGQAMFLGRLVTTGLPWQEAVTYTDKIKSVTAKDVQRIAQKYLTDERLTVATLYPLPIKAKNMKAKRRGVHHAQ